MPIDDINDLNVIVLEDIDDIVDDIQESPVKGNELSGYGKTRNLPLPKIKGSESAPKVRDG